VARYLCPSPLCFVSSKRYIGLNAYNSGQRTSKMTNNSLKRLKAHIASPQGCPRYDRGGHSSACLGGRDAEEEDASSSSNAFACFRSSVSKPSVNQPKIGAKTS